MHSAHEHCTYPCTVSYIWSNSSNLARFITRLWKTRIAKSVRAVYCESYTSSHEVDRCHIHSTVHKAAGSLVTGRSLQNGKNCCQQERPSETVPLFTASRIFRNCTSQIMEQPGTVRPAALWIALSEVNLRGGAMKQNRHVSPAVKIQPEPFNARTFFTLMVHLY